MTDEEPDARAVNAEPWEPMPGMVKLRCSACSYWFAAPAADTERCPDCVIREQRREVIRTAAATILRGPVPS
jgi:hypothetical protein